MGNNYRGGFQCLDLTKYKFGRNDVTKEEIENLKNQIVSILNNNKKPLVVNLNNVSCNDCDISFERLDSYHIQICIKYRKSNIVKIVSSESNNYVDIYFDKSFVFEYAISIEQNSQTMNGIFIMRYNEESLNITSKFIDEGGLSGDDAIIFLKNVIGIDIVDTTSNNIKYNAVSLVNNNNTIFVLFNNDLSLIYNFTTATTISEL